MLRRTPYPTPTEVLSTIQARGSNARNLRDAVHEASHALEWGLGSFAREDSIGKYSDRLRANRQYTELLLSEALARATEQMVCRMLGVDPGTVEEWVGVSLLESIKFGIPTPSPKQMQAMVESAMVSAECWGMARRILQLSKRLENTPTQASKPGGKCAEVR